MSRFLLSLLLVFATAACNDKSPAKKSDVTPSKMSEPDHDGDAISEHGEKLENLRQEILRMQPGDWKIDIKGVEVSPELTTEFMNEVAQNAQKWVKCGNSDFPNKWETHRLDFSRSGGYHVYKIDLYSDNQCTNLVQENTERETNSKFVVVKAPYAIEQGKYLVMTVSLEPFSVENSEGVTEYSIIQVPRFEEVSFEDGKLHAKYMDFNSSEETKLDTRHEVRSIEPSANQEVQVYQKDQ